jgi:hypothetical protein
VVQFSKPCNTCHEGLLHTPRFNLGNTKAKVLKGFDEKVPGQ